MNRLVILLLVAVAIGTFAAPSEGMIKQSMNIDRSINRCDLRNPIVYAIIYVKLRDADTSPMNYFRETFSE